MKKAVKKNPPKLSLYAEGSGRNINAGGNVSVVRKKTTLSGNANIGPGYRSADIGAERRISKNLTVGASVGTGRAYGVNAKLNIPIKSKSKKRK
jgi:hypothetical protein